MKPTIGRKVWFRLNGSTIGAPGAKQPEEFMKDQAMDATIVCVWGDTMVNLSVTDHGGTVHSIRSVHLRQEGEQAPQGLYCEWIPSKAEEVGTFLQAEAGITISVSKATADALERIILKIDEKILADVG